jgi:hypothetical protein
VALLAAFVLYRRWPARVRPYLFQVMTAAAVILGCGWALAVA